MSAIVLAILAVVGGGKIEWSKLTYDEGVREAGKTNRPVLVYFTADW